MSAYGIDQMLQSVGNTDEITKEDANGSDAGQQPSNVVELQAALEASQLATYQWEVYASTLSDEKNALETKVYLSVYLALTTMLSLNFGM